MYQIEDSKIIRSMSKKGYLPDNFACESLLSI